MASTDKTPTEKAEADMKKRNPKRTASIGVTNKKWDDSTGVKQPRFALYDPNHPDETVGSVADRFAAEQGMPDTYTFQLNGRRLERDQAMSKINWPKDGTVALVSIEDEE